MRGRHKSCRHCRTPDCCCSRDGAAAAAAGRPSNAGAESSPALSLSFVDLAHKLPAAEPLSAVFYRHRIGHPRGRHLHTSAEQTLPPRLTATFYRQSWPIITLFSSTVNVSGDRPI